MIEDRQKILKPFVSEKTFTHSIGVMNEMAKLAAIYILPVEDAKLAGLFHDIAKDFEAAEAMKYINELKIDSKEFEKYSNVYLHGPIGAHVIHELYPEFNPDVINAVRSHTFYTSDGENNLSWCLHLADVLAPTREWLGMKKLRRMVYEGELERSSLLLTGWLIEHFNNAKVPISDYLYKTFGRLNAEVKVEENFFERW
ncbi:MAG: bis(5'-nucleosyl)-tetraphosphatase (symmetrical) YqeK [Candidatus Delongbacteria bacterium]|nr:bis(5'-nucleosyl)-tetraphosphatase (symmetrical) YqeK [Candidatus Delongbacteria bacterium]MCG2760058.1 bis(5'-nucleosyl)-tetraphosphatase (symmetrical) YqeK [Candidatus Delongbacteria bacterium]